jgi:hypothetical protein
VIGKVRDGDGDQWSKAGDYSDGKRCACPIRQLAQVLQTEARKDYSRHCLTKPEERGMSRGDPLSWQFGIPNFLAILLKPRRKGDSENALWKSHRVGEETKQAPRRVAQRQ